MKQEEKELLLKDLCARLPYGVIVEDRNGIHELTTWNAEFTDLLYNSKCNIKPYLFPLSSMTDEQMKECLSTKHKIIKSSGKFMYLDSPNTINYYHKNHIDYRGLIPMDLEIDATGLNIY